MKYQLGTITRVLSALAVVAVCGILFAGCGEKGGNEQTETVLPTQAVSGEETVAPADTQTVGEETVGPTETRPAQETQQPATDGLSEYIGKVQGASDDSGIYAFIVTFSDKVADKGSIEYIYTGTKGSSHETETVCTYHSDYEREAAGTYDIMSYYDGKIDFHQVHKSQIKINCTFGALVRAGTVTVYYTPEGGERQEIYRAEAEQFRPQS